MVLYVAISSYPRIPVAIWRSASPKLKWESEPAGFYIISVKNEVLRARDDQSNLVDVCRSVCIFETITHAICERNRQCPTSGSSNNLPCSRVFCCPARFPSGLPCYAHRPARRNNIESLGCWACNLESNKAGPTLNASSLTCRPQNLSHVRISYFSAAFFRTFFFPVQVLA